MAGGADGRGALTDCLCGWRGGAAWQSLGVKMVAEAIRMAASALARSDLFIEVSSLGQVVRSA